MHSWEPFLLAQVGASAALTGLVFVALSINLGRIIEHRYLVGRAGEAVVLLVLPVIVGLILLVPTTNRHLTAAPVLGVATGGFVLVTRLVISGWEAARTRPTWEVRARIGLAEIAAVPAVTGAAMLLFDASAGTGVIALGAVVSIGVGIFDAWILLVEILR